MRCVVIDEPLRRGYLLDPHDGACAGQHNVVVLQIRNHPAEAWQPVALTWGPAALLSPAGTEEVVVALIEALRRGEELAAGRFSYQEEAP